MKAIGRLAAIPALVAAITLGSPPVAMAAPAPASTAAVREGFSQEGAVYVSIASGKGSSAKQAEENARNAALHGLFTGLGKDGLFASVFTAPNATPIGLNFQLIESSRDGLSFKAVIRLKIDDESVRIVEQGPYLAAAVGILDKAEVASDGAEERSAKAAAAETEGDLGSALGQYGMAVDACRSTIQLVEPVGNPSVFSSKGKRTVLELKKNLAKLLQDASAGVERVKKAESALAADATSAAANDVADAALEAADAAQALLDEVNPVLGDLSANGEDRLAPIRDRLAIQRRSLSDSRAALSRAQAALPKGKGGLVNDKLEFAVRRLATADESLRKAFVAVDREIRDPSASRAARTQAIRWAFLHQPREYLAVRAYLPFTVATTGQKGFEVTPFDLSLGFEGAFTMGGGGVWVRSQAKMVNTDLAPGAAGGDALALSQSFDFGVWGRTLVFAGYTWDWLRRVDGESLPKNGTVKLGMGGVYEHRASNERFRRADWLLSLGYELPYAMTGFMFQNVVNAGIEAQFRLGDIALLEAALSKRLDRLPDLLSVPRYVSTLGWSVGLGLRLPPPFTIGAEYFGTLVQPLMANGSLGDPTGFEGGHFRFFLQYSI